MITHELSRFITALTAAQRRCDALWGVAWGGLATLAGALLLAVLSRLIPLWYRADMLLGLVWLISGGVLLGGAIGYAWPRALSRRLRHFDRRLHLADRLTTAWELQRGDIAAPAEMARLQYHETLRAVRDADVAAAFPLRLPRWLWRTLLALGLLLVPALLFPNPQETVLANLEAQKVAAAAAAEKLAFARETLLKTPALDESARDAALKALDEALKTLQDRRSTPAERLMALTAAEQQLAELRAPDAEMQVQRLAESAPLSTERVVQPLAQALQRGAVDSAAAYLRALRDPASGTPLTPEEVQALADAFAEMADNLQATDADLAQQFRDISQEIYQGDIQGAQAAVAQAADALSQVAEANAPNEAVEQAQASVQQAASMQSGNPAQQGGASESGGAQGRGQNNGAGQGAAGNPGASGNCAGSGQSGHSEDSGSSTPYNTTTAPRFGETGSEITLPRPETVGEPQPKLGIPNPARVPYRDAYNDYVEAAEAELSRHTYPPSLRGYVREYFSGLEP